MGTIREIPRYGARRHRQADCGTRSPGRTPFTCWEDDSKFIRHLGSDQESELEALCNRNQNWPQDELASNGVKFDKHHIMVLFNLKSNADLVLFGLKHGLIAVDPEPQPRALAS